MYGARICTGSIRASDYDRERTAEALRGHYAAGRLTLDELERRLAAVWSATYQRDLRALTADLPLDLRMRVGRGLYRAQHAALKVHAVGYTSTSGALIGSWALAGGGAFWPAWFAVPGAVLLGWHAAGSRALRRALERGGPPHRRIASPR